LRDVPEAAVLRYDRTVEGLAEALVKFSRLSRQQRRAMGDAGSASATSTDWTTVARMTLDVYKEATEAKKRRSRRAR